MRPQGSRRGREVEASEKTCLGESRDGHLVLGFWALVVGFWAWDSGFVLLGLLEFDLLFPRIPAKRPSAASSQVKSTGIGGTR